MKRLWMLLCQYRFWARWPLAAISPGVDTLATPRERHNRRYLYWDIAWFGILAGIAFNFLGVYAVRLGATKVQVGAITAAPAVISIFWLIPAGQIVAQQRSLLPLVLKALFSHRVGYLMMALLPWLMPRDWIVPGMIVVAALQAFPFGLATVGFSSMLPEAISKERLGYVISRRNALMGVTSTLTVLGAGPILALLPVPLNYQVLFIIAFAAGMASLYAVSRLDIPEHAEPHPSAHSLDDLVEGLRRFRADRRFFFFSLSAFVFHWGLYMAIPLFPVYWVRTLGASDAFVSLIFTLMSGTSVVSALFMDRMLQRWGNRKVLAFSMLGISLYPTLTAMTHSLPPLLGIAVLGGLFAAGMNISLYNALIQVAPDADRARFIAIFSVLVNIAIFAAPLTGSWLAGLVGIPVVLFIAGGIRALAGLMLLWHRSAY
ncbi:MAG TPA: MFS transporter [Caldilineae bacterium]|nr:MFS transporter [Caldilineae bacterium]